MSNENQSLMLRSASFDEIGPSLQIIFKSIYISIASANGLSNGLLIFVILINKKFYKVTNIFILNLSVADILNSIFSTPFQV